VEGACGYSALSSAAQYYVGSTTKAPNITSSAGCSSRDSTSVIGWGSLPTGYLAFTCWWYDSWGTTLESDQRYATGYAWNSAPTCTSGYDLRGIATHEWGHTYGLTHVAADTGQVMKGSSGVCETTQRTLGRGDLVGIDWLY
jgi:hypothetical protein